MAILLHNSAHTMHSILDVAAQIFESKLSTTLQMANVLYQYFFDRGAVGVAGKISQIAYPSAPVQHRLQIGLPKLPSGLSAIEGIPVKQGSLGTVVTCRHEGKTVCAKTIVTEVRHSVKRDLESLEWWSSLCTFNPNILQMVKHMASRVTDEMDLRKECANGLLLAQVLQTHFSTADVACARPLACSDATWLVTEHMNGVAISELQQEDKAKALRRITEVFFELFLVHRVMLGDINLGNFLWRGSTLQLLDYGCVFRLSDRQHSFLYSIHAARDNAQTLESILQPIGIVDDVAAVIKQGSRLMWSDVDQDFSQLPELQRCVLSPSAYQTGMPPEFGPCLRACCQFYQALRTCGVSLALGPILLSVLGHCDDTRLSA